MNEKQCKEILDNLEQMKNCLTNIVDELNTNNIMGRKASFSYLDFQIDTLYEYIQETAKIVKKELES